MKKKPIDETVDNILAIYRKIDKGEIESEEEARKAIKHEVQSWRSYKALVSFDPRTTALPAEVAFRNGAIGPFHEELSKLRRFRDAFQGDYRDAFELAISAIQIVCMIRLKDLRHILKGDAKA